MKIKYNIFLIMLSAVIFMISCNTDEDSSASGKDVDITETLPEGVFSAEISNLSLSPDLREIQLSWDAPTDKNLSGYLISWKGTITDKAEYSQIVTKDETSFVIDHLYNEQYTVTVKCVSDGLLYSTGVTSSATPVLDNTPPGMVSGLNAEPLAVAAQLTWSNPSDPDLELLTLVVIDIANNEEILSVDLPPYTTTYQLVGLEENSQYKIKLTTIDYIGNRSSVSEASLKTLSEVKLSKPWEIVDFSAEEASGEGATGRAKDAIDSDEATYWHSPWTGGGSSLPQWIVFDMGKEVIPTVLTSYKRNNNNNGPTSVKVEGSKDLTTWSDFGTFALAKDNNNGQDCNLKNPVKVRYIKYTVLASPNGYAMVRNIEMRALVGD